MPADSPAPRQILAGGTVLTMNDRGDVWAPGTVVIEHGAIAGVGREAAWPLRPGDLRVDCRGYLVMPGLVNAHTHTCMMLFRGLVEHRSRDAWARSSYTLPYQDRATPDDYYWGAMLGGLEMLLGGVTAVADRFGHMSVIAQAFDALGMRAALCHTLYDLERPLELHRALELIARWGTDPARRIHCGLGPHAPDTCSDALLRRVRELADDTGARIYIHCAQSEAEIAAVRARGHAGAVRCLAAAGVLGEDVIAAHCLYVDPDEIGLLAGTGTWVAHCPASNAKIEARAASVAAMLRAGARVALGTDWAPTNNGMDLFDEMKVAGLLGKIAAGDPAALPPDRLLRMATIDGARALGLDAQAGSLEPGKRADVIALAMDEPHLQPWHDLAATLAYSAKGQDVRHVWVDGRWLIRDRRATHLDAAALRDEAARIWRRLKPAEA